MIPLFRDLRITPSFLLLLGAAACSPENNVPVVPPELAEMEADQMVLGMEHTVTVDGVRQARILADTAFRWTDSTAVALRQVDLTVYSEEGRERANVTSRAGRMDDRTEEMTAWREVVLVVPGEGGRRIESEELHYDPRTDRLRSDSTFTMLADGRRIEGVCFRSDTEFRNFEMQGEGTCELP